MENYTRNNNNAGWESQMIYAQREREQVIREQQANTIEKPAVKNYNKKKNHKNLKKNMAKVAIGLALAGGFKSLYDHNEATSTVNDAISQVKFNDSSTYDLDTSPDKIEDYELLTDLSQGGESYSFELEPGEAIHTNAENYADTYHPDYSPKHNALAQNADDQNIYFKIDKGPIYKTPDGRIAVKSENLEKTQLGEDTGIKFDKDSDGWSVIDVSPSEVRLQYGGHTLDEVAQGKVPEATFNTMKELSERIPADAENDTQKTHDENGNLLPTDNK